MSLLAALKPKPEIAVPPPQFGEDTVIGKAYDPHITRRLLKYLYPYRRRIFLALVFMTLATAGNIAGPLLIQRALDEGMGQKNIPVLEQAVGFYLLASVMIWVGTYVRVRIMAVVG